MPDCVPSLVIDTTAAMKPIKVSPLTRREMPCVDLLVEALLGATGSIHAPRSTLAASVGYGARSDGMLATLPPHAQRVDSSAGELEERTTVQKVEACSTCLCSRS